MEQRLLNFAKHGFSIITPLYRDESQWKKECGIEDMEDNSVHLTGRLRGLELIIMAQKSKIICRKNNNESEDMALPWGREWRSFDRLQQEVKRMQPRGLHDYDELFPWVSIFWFYSLCIVHEVKVATGFSYF
eukprot:TRINITY_DN5443_c0_g1_i1.p1 TRINITY_DN5443_c0_g1~~TRINITY_DN5443_c0_g1_i1.p1  ORF type:complete len:150 (+),score=18.36 TRINITY_DN5443_c0_g1_i1:56-451(+)